jgi:hypothetical protein
MTVNRLLSAAANGDGTTIDLGAGADYDKINIEMDMPATVTAATITIAGSTDNFDTSDVPIVVLSKVLKGSVTVRMFPAYRYLRAELTAYAGSGTIVVDAEAGVSNPQG